ncbi:MAG: TonB family protein [Novosphingobium sp.]
MAIATAPATRVRVVAAVATLVLHVLGGLAAALASHGAAVGGAAPAERLVVFSRPALQAVPQPPPRLLEPAMVRPRTVAARAGDATLPVAPPAPLASATTAVGGTTGSAQAAVATPAVAPVVGSSPPVAAPSIDAARDDTALAVWREALWKHIAARRPRGLAASGTVEVRFRMDKSGRLLEAAVAVPSGNAMLDALALRTVRVASPYPRPPEDVRPADLAFVIPVNFR